MTILLLKAVDSLNDMFQVAPDHPLATSDRDGEFALGAEIGQSDKAFISDDKV